MKMCSRRSGLSAGVCVGERAAAAVEGRCDVALLAVCSSAPLLPAADPPLNAQGHCAAPLGAPEILQHHTHK